MNFIQQVKFDRKLTFAKYLSRVWLVYLNRTVSSVYASCLRNVHFVFGDKNAVKID